MFEFLSNINWIFWLCAMILFIIIEAASVSLLSIWFVLGSLVALILAVSGVSVTWQIIIFFIVSSLALLFFLFVLKPKWNRKIQKQEKTNADRILGQEGIVIQTINPLLNTGQVRVKGQIWSATTYQDLVLEQGTLIVVQELKGVKAYVTPLPPTAAHE